MMDDVDFWLIAALILASPHLPIWPGLAASVYALFIAWRFTKK